MSRPLVLLFPGQSSRDPEMFQRARAVDPEEAERALDDFARLAGRTFDGRFESNTDVQLAVHLVTRVYRRRLARTRLRIAASAGLSLGEYAHLLQIGALTDDDADALIATRGRLYDAGPEGTMLAVTPGRADEVQAVLDDVRARSGIDPADLAISNYNSARQVVIAGSHAAVAAAREVIERDLFALTTTIEDRVPMHVARFAPVAEAMAGVLAQVPWHVPHATWWSNVTGNAVVDPCAEVFARTMAAHVAAPVRWAQVIDALTQRHPRAVLLEVGPGRVLTGLNARSGNDRDTVALALDRPGGAVDFDRRVQEVLDACG